MSVCITRVVACPLRPNLCLAMPRLHSFLLVATPRVVTLMLLIFFMGLCPSSVEVASTNQKKKKTLHSSVKRHNGHSKPRKGRKVRIKVVPLTALSVVKETVLGSGVRYAQYRSNGSKPIAVYVVTMDRTQPGNALRMIKGEDHAMGLERLPDMARRYDSISNNELYATINGNFWRAVRNTMIGPCVIDGEVVELSPYKKWTCAFIDVKSQVVMDSITLTGQIRLGTRTFAISSVNRRNDTGVVVYNSFGGQTVPHVTAKETENAFHEAVKDSVFAESDSTEVALTKDILRAEIQRVQREVNIEYPMIKVRVRYLRSPSVNVPFPCQVLGVDTGTVTMPLRGAIVSFPRAVLAGLWPRIGDTLTLAYTTSLNANTRFMNAVCGTPRLVRNGVAKHEAQTEGSTGRRFIQDGLARSAIGVDRSGNRIILVAIRSDRPEDGTYGASLQQTAKIMALLGCYNAMNLDGGGSAGMVVGADHVFFNGIDPLTRRVGLGIGIVKLSKILRSQH